MNSIQKWFKAKPDVKLGVDINRTHVRLVELCVHPNGDIELLKNGVVQLDGSVVNDREVKEEALLPMLTRLLNSSAPATKRSVTSMPSQQVLAKIVQVPPGISLQALEMRLTLEAEKHVAYPLQELRLDFVTLKHSKATKQDEVLLVACRVGLVNAFKQLFERAALLLEAIDVDAYAIARAVMLLDSGYRPAGRTAVLAIAGYTITLIILEEGEVPFFRSQNFNGRTVLEECAKEADKSLAVVLENWHNPDSELYRTFNWQEKSKVLSQECALHMKRLFEFYFSAGQFDVTEVILTGELAPFIHLPGLAEATPQYPLRFFNPFPKLKLYSPAHSEHMLGEIHSWTTSLGLALWTPSDA